MTQTGIRKDVDGAKGRYVLTQNGEEAELTFSIASPTLVIADHTAVPDSLRGTGAGARLLEQLVSDARADGFKIVPLCPFINRQRAKNPDWADVFSV